MIAPANSPVPASSVPASVGPASTVAASPVTASPLDHYDPSGAVRTLFRHTLRDQWGLGIVLHKLGDRVCMQFQDGRERSFKRGYYHLIDAVDRPLDVTMGIVRALESMTDDDRKKTTGSPKRPVSMEEQIALFRELFPGGFQDEAYAAHHRGDGRKRPLKRHRDVLVETAQKLSKREMSRMLGALDHEAVHAAATAIVNVTDLVSAKERARFAAIEPEHHEAVATSLFALLHGSSRLSVRFDAFVRALEKAMGETPSWGLATLFSGAVVPKTDVAVREKVLALQAVWMAPGLSLSGRPMGILHERLVAMTKSVKEQLEAEGFEPRDMLDVTDFMWATLRPKAQKRILEMRLEQGLGVTPKVEQEAAAEQEAA